MVSISDDDRSSSQKMVVENLIVVCFRDTPDVSCKVRILNKLPT